MIKGRCFFNFKVSDDTSTVALSCLSKLKDQWFSNYNEGCMAHLVELALFLIRQSIAVLTDTDLKQSTLPEVLLCFFVNHFHFPI